MRYTPPPYEEYIKDWKVDKENFQLRHICGFEGRWIPSLERSSGIKSYVWLNPQRIAKFDKLLNQRGITNPADHVCALGDLFRQVEEIYVRDFKPRRRPPQEKTHWEPVSNQSQPAINTFPRTNEGR